MPDGAGGAGAPPGAAELELVLRRVQNELFNVGSDLATLPEDRHPKQPVVELRHTEALEKEIDTWNEQLPELRSSSCPGAAGAATCTWPAPGGPSGSACAARQRPVVPNRLSDALFVMSRHACRLYGQPEPLWEPEKT